jgi:hypothetical protein
VTVEIYLFTSFPLHTIHNTLSFLITLKNLTQINGKQFLNFGYIIGVTVEIYLFISFPLHTIHNTLSFLITLKNLTQINGKQFLNFDYIIGVTVEIYLFISFPLHTIHNTLSFPITLYNLTQINGKQFIWGTFKILPHKHKWTNLTNKGYPFSVLPVCCLHNHFVSNSHFVMSEIFENNWSCFLST